MTQVENLLQAVRPEFDFAGSQDFIEDGILDSFDVMTLVADLDKTYGICIAGIDIVPEYFRNLASIESLLDKYRQS